MSAGHDDIEISLRWHHGRGAYDTYFRALARGRAVGSRDGGTGNVSFPPRPGDERVELSGEGIVRALTRGPAVLPMHHRAVETCFALIAMDGAHNLSFGRVLEDDGPVAVGDRVRLTGAGGPVPHPAQHACYARLPPGGDSAPGDPR